MTKEIFEEMREDLKDIKKLLTGNGGIGLCEKVRDHATTIKELKRMPHRIKYWIFAALTFLLLLANAGERVLPYLQKVIK